MDAAVLLKLPVSTTDDGDLTFVTDDRLKPFSTVAVVAKQEDTADQCIFDGLVLSHKLHLTTGAVASELFNLLHDAYVADTAVRDFLLRENPPAAAAIADRLEAARRRGIWHPRRNDIDATLTALRPEPSPLAGEGREGGREATR